MSDPGFPVVEVRCFTCDDNKLNAGVRSAATITAPIISSRLALMAAILRCQTMVHIPLE